MSFSEKTSSGTSVLIRDVECKFVNVPLHNIYLSLSSDLVTGLVAVGIRPSLPFKASLTFKCMTELLFADFSYSIALDTYL